ncbi:MAG: NUDIX domain-containing protein [Nocardioides sp.]
MPWPVVSSRDVYENPWIRVREDVVERPGGGRGNYGVMTVRQPAVFVVALTDDDEVLLVNVDRHTVGPSLEVPAGGSDGEDPLVAARRELLEETGHRAEQWHPLGRLQALNGICEAPEHFFLARALSLASEDRHEQRAEGISSVSRIPVAEVLAMVRHGEISDAESIAALMLALTHLGRVR